MIDSTPQQVLNTPIPTNDANASTIGHFLIELLHALWREQDEFSGKRPFGNSSWDSPLIIGLINAGYIDGQVDDDGYLDEYDVDLAYDLIDHAIEALLPIPSPS